MTNSCGLRHWLVQAIAAAAVMLAGASSGWTQEKVYITEFMAANIRTLADRDREYSDWIELYNAGAMPVNLEGWFLTDDPDELKKWRFPAVPIAANEYLLVFASKKDRRTPGTELHTNFKLDAARGYLGLVKPDGTTITSEFGRQYPLQVANASYGFEMGDRTTPLLPSTAPKRVLVPVKEGGMKWAGLEFDDSDWTVATNGVGFQNETNQATPPGTDLREAMMGKNASAYLRATFMVADPAFDTLQLRLRCDDGFVAYLNGAEVARHNAPAKPLWNSTATAAQQQPVPAILNERFGSPAGSYTLSQLDPLTRPRIFLNETNAELGYLRLVNGRISNQVNSIVFPQTVTGQVESVVVEFDFRWKSSGDGTERLVFLLLPIAQYGASGEGLSLTTFREMKDPKFPGVLAVQLLHSPENGQKALTVHWDRNKRTSVDLPSAAFGQRIFHRAQVRLKHTEQGGLVTISLISDVNGNRKQLYTPVPQLLIPELRPYQSRAQFAARIGHWDQTIDLDNIRMEFLAAGHQGAELFDLSSHVNVLRAGKNVLAIHGLNHTPNDPSFVLLPELVGGYSSVRSTDARYFATPTPRAANRAGLRGVSPPPIFSNRGGVFTNTVRVALTAKEGAVRYTLDGSEPSLSSQAYSEPISLNSSTLLKAKTFAPDLLPSATVAETFTLLDETAVNFNSNLPLLVINPFGQYLSANNRSTVSLRLIDTVKGRSSLSSPADFDGRASVNVRGFSTLRQPKNSLTLRLKDENDDKVKAPLLGLPKESDWVLYAPYADKTLIRDVLAYELSNNMGRYAPRTRLVEVFIDRSGGKLGQRDYMGVYVLVEKIKINKSRVNITELSASDTAEPAITGGYLFKRDHSDRYEPSFRTSQSHYFYVDPKPVDMSRDQVNWLTRYMSQFERALYGPEFRDPKKGYAAYLDADSFIDQHWLVEMSKNIDGFRYSAFMHKERGGKLQMGPAWDWNLAFGNADYYDGSDPTGWYTPVLRDSEICWFRRLNEDPRFEQRCIDRWGELSRSTFASATILARVDELAAQLREAQARNFRRWPILGRRVNPNDFVGRSYEEEINWMKQWIQRRIGWINSQFVAPAATAEANGAVTLRAAAGKILYTLDGTDPRLPEGGVSPKAQTYSAPIPVTKSGNLFARVHNRNGWSSPTVMKSKENAQTTRGTKPAE
jgi:hypothetical protein